jgi:hypothetical protein
MRILSRLIAALAAVLVLPAVLAGAASAAVPGLTLVTKTSPASSLNKSELAFCPSGTSLTGAGGAIGGGNGEVTLDDVTPEGTFGSSAFGREDATGFGSSWSVTASAICALPLPGVQLVSAFSASSSATKSVTATCPAGKLVVGAGAQLNTNATGGVTLDDVRPSTGLTSVTALGREMDGGTTANWTITARAMCALPPAGLQRVEARSTPASFVANSVGATCPSGKKVLGGGAEINGGLGRVVLKQMQPNGAILSGFVASAAETQAGQTGNWDIRSYAICASV